VRQLEFALFDIRMHAEYVPGKTNHVAQTLAKSVRAWLWSHRRHSIASAKLLAYLRRWLCRRLLQLQVGEVLSADAFSAFEEQASSIVRRRSDS